MIKVLFDTNALISGISWKKGKASQALNKALTDSQFEVYITELILKELEIIYSDKLKGREDTYIDFKENILNLFTTLKDTEKVIADEVHLPDLNDRIIYRTATFNHIDLLITGDKAFLEAGIQGVKVLSINEFIQLE